MSQSFFLFIVAFKSVSGIFFPPSLGGDHSLYGRGNSSGGKRERACLPQVLYVRLQGPDAAAHSAAQRLGRGKVGGMPGSGGLARPKKCFILGLQIIVK